MERILGGIETDAVPPEFTLVDGEVVVTLGEPAERCCGDGVGELIADALMNPSNRVIAMPLVPVETPEAQAAAYGIRELVSEFTTNHACCQGRVENIQRMADIVRGAVILPGESFSLNGYVGQRTRANGFVPAGTILSVLLIVGVAPLPALIGLWVVYLSLSVAGQVFLRFQWDALLLEATLRER